MSAHPRFTLIMTLRDNESFGQDGILSVAVGVDQQVKISLQSVDMMKIGFGSFESTVELIRRKEFRKKLFVETAERLGTLLAERMEDAEGWHDASRIEPARAELRKGQPS